MNFSWDALTLKKEMRCWSEIQIYLGGLCVDLLSQVTLPPRFLIDQE